MKKILLLILILFSLTGCTKNPLPSSTSKTNEPFNTIDIKDRPYVTLAPTVGGKHPLGREVTFNLSANALKSQSVEYELEYQAGSLLQAAFGQIDLTKDRPPLSQNLLLGSCSAGGKCAYHENVTGGTLTLRFKGGSQNFTLKGEWNLQKNADRAGQFSSRDAKFQIDFSKIGLPISAIVIVAQTFGLPRELDGQILAGPYGIFTNDQKFSGSAKLTLHLNETTTSANLLGWDGKSWKKYPSDIKDKTLTSTVDRLTTFVVTASQ